MAQVAKVLHALALEMKAEAGYGTAATLSATTDGVLLQYKDKNQGAPLTYGYMFDGTVGPSIGNLGQSKRIPPSGLYIKGSLPMNFRGAGAAYSATVRSSLDRPLTASGFDATVDTTASAEKVTYSPTAAGTGYTSLTANLWARGQKMIATGVIGSIKCDSGDLSAPDWTFDLNGIATLPTDAAVTAITYPGYASVAPPGGNTAQLTLGNFTAANAVIRKWSFDMQRKVKERVNQGATAGFAGYAADDRQPILKVTLEATALTGSPFTTSSAFDPYNLRDSAQTIAVVMQLGTAQYNRIKINFAQAQVIDAQDSSDGPVATVDLTIAGFNSTPTSNDDVTIVTD